MMTETYHFTMYLKKLSNQIVAIKKIHHSAGFCTPTHVLIQCTTTQTEQKYILTNLAQSQNIIPFTDMLVHKSAFSFSLDC